MNRADDPTQTYTTTWFDTWRFVDGKADEHWDPATLPGNGAELERFVDQAIGDGGQVIDAYREALTMNPLMEGPKEALEELERLEQAI